MKLRTGLLAGAVAGVLSGAPSTIHALVKGQDPLAATRAAGNVVLPAAAKPASLFLAGAAVHVALSIGWGTVLSVVLPRTSPHAVARGAAAGLAMAAIDLGLIAHGLGRRRMVLVRGLPVLPQVADHVAFGVVAGVVIARADRG